MGLSQGDCCAFFQSCLTPPEKAAVVAAMERLEVVGAIEISPDRKAALTGLWHSLSRLPLDANRENAHFELHLWRP